MFGLLQRQTNGNDTTACHDYRLHYCGTCKTMGALYGQRSRMLLNFDAVFFAELLSNLNGDDIANWHANYQKQNCFALPPDENTMPTALRYAATANVLLAELKNDDNLRDGGGVLWRSAKWVLNNSYQQANKAMQAFGLDTSLLWEEIEAQEKLEKYTENQSLTLADFAVPTRKMTALVVAQAASVLEKKDLHDDLYEVGSSLGELVYFLDALEDLVQDAKNKTFNAFLRFFKTEKLDAIQLTLAAQTVQRAEQRLAKALQNLPLADAIKEEMTARLSANVLLRCHKIVPTAASDTAISELAKAGKSQPTTTTVTESTKVLLYSLVVIAFPQVSGAIGNGSKHNWSLAAMAVAIWAALWTGKKAKQTCENNKNALQDVDCCNNGGGNEANGCIGACLTGCLTACCQAICNATCNICVETMCSWCKGRDGGAWTAFFVIVVCLALLIGVAYLIIKLGVA